MKVSILIFCVPHPQIISESPNSFISTNWRHFIRLAWTMWIPFLEANFSWCPEFYFWIINFLFFVYIFSLSIFDLRLFDLMNYCRLQFIIVYAINFVPILNYSILTRFQINFLRLYYIFDETFWHFYTNHWYSQIMWLIKCWR